MAILLKLLIFLLLASLPLLGQGDFTDRADAFFKRYVSEGRVDYNSLANDRGELTELTDYVGTRVPAQLSPAERKAYLINAYNLLVIEQAVERYPLKSVLEQSGFFDSEKQVVGGRRLTLNELEKRVLFGEFPDARLHFVLVCGALGCPPITNFAYRPDELDAQLDRQTRRALDDPRFIRVSGKQVELSQIFEWYAKDFGGTKARVIEWINRYRDRPLPTDADLSYYTYDWSLNGTVAADPGPLNATGGANNAARYVVSSAIPVGTFEIKVFNNRYSQEAGSERSTFFTSTLTVLYGVADRINVGINGRYRTVGYRGGEMDSNRHGLTGFGPMVRIAPFERLPNFSVQSSFTFALGDDLTGAAGMGGRFIDWDGPVSFTQVFNDFPIGNNFSFFGEIDLLVEDIGARSEGRSNRLSTPVTGILSYFPTPKTTVYGLASYSPFWQETYDYFYQLGGGVKYQFTPKFEVELLATAFQNQFLSAVMGTAGTLNLGVRFNI
jgi:hypothetical protein